MLLCMATAKSPNGEVLGITLGYPDGFKLGVKEVEDLLSPDSSFEGSNGGNLEG